MFTLFSSPSLNLVFVFEGPCSACMFTFNLSICPQDDLSRYPADSEQQQAAVLAVADNSNYNWGYDPVRMGAASVFSLFVHS